MSGLGTDRDKLVANALSRLHDIRRSKAFDPAYLDSRPTEAQQSIIDDFGKIKTQWIVAANRSGKSQTCARLLSWALTDSHPTWRTPPEWLEEGMLILLAGPSSKIMEESLWPKIRSYLDPDSYKEVKQGNAIQKVEIGKHRIVFQSMENPSKARERIQSYDAHIAWVDEQLEYAQLISEIRLRVTTKQGLFLASFTPIDPSPEIERMVDAAALPLAKRYNLQTLDNPVFQSEEAKNQLLSTFVGLTPDQIATRLTGKWAISDSRVYYFNWDKMVKMPEGYSPMWRHIESVDPALSSALGLVIIAENPDTGHWYLVHSEYIRGIQVPTELVAAVRERTKSLNIVKRISDPHEVWYIQTASSLGLHYTGVYKKNDRKDELIKKMQESLGKQLFVSPHNEDWIEEIRVCRTNPETGKIINASKFHLLDATMYATDQLPKFDRKLVASSWDDYLYKANETRKQDEEKTKQKIEKYGRIRGKNKAGKRPLPGNLGKFRWF